MPPSDHIRVFEFNAAVQSYLGYSNHMVTGPPFVGEVNYGNGRGRQVTEVNISPKMNISAHTPKMALHENPAPPGSWIVIFLHGPQKMQFFCTK